MPLPAQAILPSLSALRALKAPVLPLPSLVLEHEEITLPNTQKRLAGRIALKPNIDLNDWSFCAVIDWIEFSVYLGRGTQIQHLQKILRKTVGRNCHIVPHELAAGNVFTSCTIKVQEPETFARVAAVDHHLRQTYGLLNATEIVGLEVSIDAYPVKAGYEARARLLGVLQRTISTSRDIWSQNNSRPRMNYGPPSTAPRGQKGPTERLSPGPDLDHRNGSRSDPHSHKVPFIDSTMYLGAKGADVMIGIMDKVKDRQHPNGSYMALPDAEKRSRIEVTIRGAELGRLGVSDIKSLRTLKLSAFQRRYFQFQLPTFPAKATGAGAVGGGAAMAKAVMHNTQQSWRAQTYLKSGITGLMTKDAATMLTRKRALKALTTHLMDHGMKLPDNRQVGTPPAFVAYTEFCKKVSSALVNLERRQATAWKGSGI